MTQYIGIDPGSKGAIAFLSDEGTSGFCKLPEYGENQLETIYTRLKTAVWPETKVRIALEQIDPRPTFWKGKSSILKSTCLLYANYMAIRMALTIISTERNVNLAWWAVPPSVWQPALGATKSGKEESSVDHKRKLKELAQKLYPQQTITLVNCDAVLLAHYARKKFTGKE